jgi:hypothetical protein
MELNTTQVAAAVHALGNLPAFYGTRRFNTASTRALNLSLYNSNPQHPILFIQYLYNIIHSGMSWSSYWPLSLWLSHQQSSLLPLLPVRAIFPRPSHPPCLDQSNYTCSLVYFHLIIMSILWTFVYPSSVHNILDPPGRNVYILSNRFPSTVISHFSVQIFQSCKPIWDLNTIILFAVCFI